VKAAILFDNLGPYHMCRIREISPIAQVVAIEFGGVSASYDWSVEYDGLKVVTLNPNGTSWDMNKNDFKQKLKIALDNARPDVVFVPGWGFRGGRYAMKWCVQNKVPMVIMSESTQWDTPRNFIREWTKIQLVSLASSALVGGQPHTEYLETLKMPKDHIFQGYDVVDNDYFQKMALKKKGYITGSPYFLASNRFVEKKNLLRLINAYNQYLITYHDVRETNCIPMPPPWPLILLGDGELMNEMLRYCRKLKLPFRDMILEPLETFSSQIDCFKSGGIIFAGFRQIEDLPAFYANAGTFVHASTTEQWGLVVNEAMASGLPVIVSNHCGCALDLVHEGVNGFTFDPYDTMDLNKLMQQFSCMSPESLAEMGQEGYHIVNLFASPASFRKGFEAAAKVALERPVPEVSLISRLLLEILCLR